VTNVFISWSGEQSKSIAEELRNWIPSVLQFARPYFTPNDIEKGAKWGNEISKKLAECNVGIICLTKENLAKPWILFEAGALSKDLDRSKVCSILFGLETTDLSGPLTTFQTTSFERSDFKKMMQSINETAGANSLAKETFDRVFDMWWPQLHEKIAKIINSGTSAKDANLRSDRELLEEILLTARSISRSSRPEKVTAHISPSLVKELANSIGTLLTINTKLLSTDLNDDVVPPLLQVLDYMNSASGFPSSEIAALVEMYRKAQEDFIPF
jgi:hypothetical protein